MLLTLLNVTLLSCVLMLYLLYISSALYSMAYCHWFYRRFCSSHCDADYAPSCVILIPCKDAIKNLAFNLQAFLQQDYSHYRVIFSVASETDTAYPVLCDLVKQYSHASIIIAGVAQSCGQKNWNLLQALNQIGLEEVYIFADSDIAPSPQWLKNLILPLSCPKITVATGFRNVQMQQPTLAKQNHFMASNLLCLGMIGLNRITPYVWGGTIAIRRNDFVQLKVAELWAKTAIDDISLSQLLSIHKKRAIVASTCFSCDATPLETHKEVFMWFKRQMLCNKFYRRSHWIWFVGMSIGTLLAYSCALIFWLLSIDIFLIKALFFIWLATDLTMVAVLLSLKQAQKPLSLLLHATWYQWFYMAAAANTLFCNTMSWAATRYFIDNQGNVVRAITH